MNHSFNVRIATEYGMLEAVLMEHLYFWIEKNKANNVNFYDGYYWTYNSVKALSELFPYASKNTISKALHHLEKEGLIIVGNYNKSAYDRTTWYALTEKAILLLKGIDNSQCEESADVEMDIPKIENGFIENREMDNSENRNGFTKSNNSIYQKSEMEEPKIENGFTKSKTPIPDINTDIETDNNLTVSKDTVCRTDVQRVIEQWNSLSAYGIKPVSSIRSGTKRYDMLNARIRSYGIEKVLEAAGNIKNGAFLCGGGKKGWIITFEWFVRPNNFIKVLEGNYDDASPDGTGQASAGSSGYPRELLKMLAGGKKDG